MPIAGNLITESLEYDGGRKVTVYVPPEPPEAVVFAGDGQLISQWAAALEAADVPSTMIVGAHGLADETLRLHEYSPGLNPERFTEHERFFVEDVRRWVAMRFGVSLPASRTAVFGVSASGELALAMGLRHSDIYGAILCASPGGGYRPPGAMPSSVPRTYLVAGTREPFFLENAARWADALRDAGADVVMHERPGAHGDAFWQEEFPLMVAWAFGQKGASKVRARVQASHTQRARAMLHRDGAEDLARHLETTYAIRPTAVLRLDVAVFRVDRVDGPSWVARVFPAERPLESAAGDARMLRVLEEVGYAAERCAAPEPVSALDGQAVLVTGYVDSVPPAERAEAIRGSGGYARLGALLGRLHTLPKDQRIVRPGGCWHHLGDGSPHDELVLARRLLVDAAERVSGDERLSYQAVQEELEQLDDGFGLPEALIHPDFVLANAIATPDQKLVLVDWTGAGWGPRIWSLAWLLYTAAVQDVRRVDRVLAGYRRHIALDPEELTRLEGVVAVRPIVLEAWAFSVGRKSLREAAEGVTRARALAHAVAEQVSSGRWREMDLAEGAKRLGFS